MLDRKRILALDSSKARKILDRDLGSVLQYLRDLHAQEVEGRRSELFEAIYA